MFLAAALALAPACGKQEAIQLQLITTACTGLGPLDDVTHLRIRITGEGLEEPIERLTTDRWRASEVPTVPAGKGRVVEVRGYTGYPDGGKLVSVGRSVPFDVPEGGEKPVAVRVFLRRVGSFVPPSSAEAPDACQPLLSGARAGHTATLLKDGRVLLAGGFRAEAGSGTSTVTITEYFDPVTGTLTPGPELPARAMHTATALPNGQVLLAGGERVTGETPVRLNSATLFDPLSETGSELELLEARSRHAAAVDEGGRVLLVGGVGATGQVVSVAEGFDASGNGFVVPTPVARVGMAVVPLQGGKQLAVVGGSDGRELQRDVLTFSFDGTTFDFTGAGGVLMEPRRGAAVAPFQDARHLVVAGGYGDAEEPGLGTRTLASAELVAAGQALEVKQGPSIMARGDACAVALADGRVVTVGGRRARGNGLRSTGEVEVLTPAANATAGALGMVSLESPRYLHTCTALPDGTVLIAGGVNDSEGEARVLDEVLIFTPPPRD